MMDKVALVKSQMKLERWRQIIADCQASGLNVKHWCSQNNISKDQYYYWLRKIREMTVDNMTAIEPVSSAASNISFKPLQVGSALTTSLTVHLPQATVEIPDGASQETVEAVLRALKSVC